jgi:CTP synthase
MLSANGLDEVVCRELSLESKECDMKEWNDLVIRIGQRKDTISIAIVGKYVKLHDAYLSIIESLNHAGFDLGAGVKIKWIDSEDVTEGSVSTLLSDVDGILVPGGFGDRGIEGKITACRYARENNIPYFGICLGMQIAVIEFARHVCGLENANSGEFNADTEHRVIDIMEDQVGITQKGGTMRLGAYPCKVIPNTKMASLYKAAEISERHRHRYEFNNKYRTLMMEHGLMISGVSPDERLVEAVELPGKRFFVGVQFHPEFKSRPNKPHPLFLGFVEAALEGSKQKQQ